MNRQFPRPLSIRGKMTLAALTPLIIILVLVSFAISYLINAWILGESQKRVQHDLDSARAVYSHELDRIRDVVRFTANMATNAESLQNRQLDRLIQEINAVRNRESLDFLMVTDTHGNDLNDSSGTTPPDFVLRAIRDGGFSGTVLLTPAQMMRIDSTLPRQASIPFINPDGSRSDGDETKGMFLVAATEIHNANGKPLGCLYGGVLLNNNLRLVDRIKQIVYGEERFEGIEVGSATLFLGDLRVATTIRLKNGERAMGTRVSPEVARSVLEKGQNWLARAKVVDEWYLTAYEPILNATGSPIGALYVGLLEKPFDALKTRTSLIQLGLLVLGVTLGYLLSREISRHLSRPILELDAMAQKVAHGERNIRLSKSTTDEIGDLTRTFNRMTASLEDREDQLNRLNQQLELKVHERTRQLEERNLELLRTKDELVRTEKLAAIGSLAAGVAHEINNPAAIIRGNVEILLMELSDDESGREEAEEIMKQTERIASITRHMLTFAREQAVHPKAVDLNDLLDDILSQVSHQVEIGEVDIIRDFTPNLWPLFADEEHLRQVFTNIILNALQALAGKGTLLLETHLDDKIIEVAITDTGPGIPERIRSEIFNPFFTTRPHGTGLGLSTAYGIVQALGGSIDVESPGEGGTLFRVRLPIHREKPERSF